MKLIYNLGNRLYWVLANLLSPFNSKAKLFVSGRKNWRKRLASDLKDNQYPVAWFHCASLGEFEQGRPVIESFREQYPDYKILLTFFSPSGYEVRKNYAGANWIHYLPLDTASNAETFISIAKPKIAFFVKYEFWHHYIIELRRQQIPVISFSAIFRENQPFFKSWGAFNRNILSKMTHFFVQTAKSVELLKSIGIKEATLTGDTRFDRVYEICQEAKEIELAEKFKQYKPTFVLGSTWKADLEVVAPVLDAFNEPLKIIIAPHEIASSDVALAQSYFKSKKTVAFSEAHSASVHEYDVLIVDNFGMLSSLYGYADFAYIGGAFGKGLHNTLEAATFGVPIFFGNKKHHKFQEAQDMLAQKSAFAIANSQEFSKIFTTLYSDLTLRQQVGEKNASYVKHHLGATKQIIDYCSLILASQ